MLTPANNLTHEGEKTNLLKRVQAPKIRLEKMITHFNLVNLVSLLQIGPCRIGTLRLGISCNVSSEVHSSVFLLTVAFLVTSVAQYMLQP